MEYFEVSESFTQPTDRVSKIMLGLLDQRGTSMNVIQRLLFGIAAIGCLFERAPWAETQRLVILAALALPVSFGTLAITGAAPGRPRILCYFIGIVAIILVFAKAVFLPSA